MLDTDLPDLRTTSKSQHSTASVEGEAGIVKAVGAIGRATQALAALLQAGRAGGRSPSGTSCSR